MDVDKTLTRATLGAALIGLLIIVYALATDSIPATSKGYSEVYFEKPSGIPDAMKAGEKYPIPFVVSSNERKDASYNYTATFDGMEVARGRFTLAPKEKKTLTIVLVPNPSSWKLSSNSTRRIVDNFNADKLFVKEEKDGSVLVYPVELNKSKPGEKGLLLLPLNEAGFYSGESRYDVNGSEVWVRSSMSITWDEINLHHSYQAKGYNFTWTNRIKLSGLGVVSQPVAWLAVPKRDYPGEVLGRSTLAYKNMSLDLKNGLPGEVYLSPLVGLKGGYIISYSSTNATANKVKHIQRNTTITVDNGISFENLIEEKIYTYEKAKLSIQVNSDVGKSYEIHSWSYVND